MRRSGNASASRTTTADASPPPSSSPLVPFTSSASIVPSTPLAKHKEEYGKNHYSELFSGMAYLGTSTSFTLGGCGRTSPTGFSRSPVDADVHICSRVTVLGMLFFGYFVGASKRSTRREVTTAASNGTSFLPLALSVRCVSSSDLQTATGASTGASRQLTLRQRPRRAPRQTRQLTLLASQHVGQFVHHDRRLSSVCISQGCRRIHLRNVRCLDRLPLHHRRASVLPLLRRLRLMCSSCSVDWNWWRVP